MNPSNITNPAASNLRILGKDDTYVTVGGATADFQVSKYLDIGEAINAAYASLPIEGGTIFIQNGTYSFSTPIVFGIDGKIASLIGASASSTYLKYTPVSGNAITVDHGDTGGRHRQHEVARFALMGTSSFVYNGTVNTRTSVGLFLGGTNGCPAINVHDMTINGFGTQLETGANVYMTRFSSLSLSGGNGVNSTSTGLQGSLVHINSFSNSGERMVFTDCTFADPCNSAAGNSVYVESSGSASLIFRSCSFDNTQLRVINSTHTVIENCHIENPAASIFGEYVPMYFDSYNAGTLFFIGNQIVDSQSNPSLNFANIVRHGVNLTAIGNHFSNYGGQSHARMFDCTLGTANESELIMGTVVEGSGVVEIARNWAYTGPRGVAVMQNYRNSWPTGIIANVDNTVDWKTGSAVSAITADDTGNVRMLFGTRTAIQTRSASYTATKNDDTILCSASGASMTITLPPVSGLIGARLTIKKIDSSANTVTIDGNSAETIDGAATKVLSTQWSTATLQSDGTAWFVLSSI